MLSDEEIAIRLLKKDFSVIDEVMERYNKLLWAVAGGILNNVGTVEDIEDCVSDAYVRLLEKPRRFDSKKGSLKSFIAEITKNIAIDRYRKLIKAKAAETDTAIGVFADKIKDANPLEAVVLMENRDNILNALGNLSETDREIIIRRFILGGKVNEITTAMGIGAKEVENRLYRSKLKLRKILQVYKDQA